MAQTLLESLTWKQLFIFATILFLVMVSFFAIGGTKGADPASANIHIANLFVPLKSYKYKFDSSTSWVWYRLDDSKKNAQQGYKEGKMLDLLHNSKNNITPQSLVLSTRIPHPGSQMYKDYQFMLVVLSVQMDFLSSNIQSKQYYNPKSIECTMTFSAKIAYSNKDKQTSESDWTLLTKADNQERPLKCKFSQLGHVKEDHIDGYYTCDDQQFFELGSVAHKYYLLNVQFLASKQNKHCLASQENFFNGIHLTEIHQNRGYTISLFVSKTVMFPFIVAALLFFIRRVKREQREFLLLEKSIMWLGIATSILLFPMDWFSLVIDMPFMLLFSDLRQGLFYTALLIFWCLFAGEHILVDYLFISMSMKHFHASMGCVDLHRLGI